MDPMHSSIVKYPMVNSGTDHACIEADIPTPKVKYYFLHFCCHGEFSVKYKCQNILLLKSLEESKGSEGGGTKRRV
jgi:hypothetical protein